MSIFSIVAILITLTAFFSYINHRFIKLPGSIGLMLMSLVVSLAFVVLKYLNIPFVGEIGNFVGNIPFQKILLEGILGFLLFAGALHVNINDLMDNKIEIGIFATFGVLISTALVGYFIFALSGLLGLGLSLIYCFLFGALISPTDPIAVLGILKKAKAPKSLEIKITGESLFNDGIGVVVYMVIYEFITAANNSGISPGAGQVLKIFMFEAVGGILFGFVIGYIGYLFLKSIDYYEVEILVTLAVVAGGYALALALHISGPLAMVIAGLLIGNRGRKFAMSDVTREHLDTFWRLIDEILNALLFVLIGLEVMVLTLKGIHIIAGLIAIPLVLLARFISVGLPVGILRKWRDYAPRAVSIITWGGLRGGISVALALSITGDILGAESARESILTMTYIIVAFSILVQGMTIQKLIPSGS